MSNSSASPAGSQANSHWRGIVYMLVALLVLTVSDALVKLMLEKGMGLVQLLAIRGWILTAALFLWAARGGRPGRVLATAHPWAHLVRILGGVAMTLLFFNSLKTMPLGDATVVFFAAPFMMAALSVPILGEKVGVRRWLAIAAGFAGVVIALQPGTDIFRLEAVLILGASAGYAVTMLVGRRIGGRENTFRLVFYFNAGLTAVMSLLAVFTWTPLPDGVVPLLLLFCLSSVVAQLCLTRAFALAPVGVIVPFEYTGLVWAFLLGYLIWGVAPGPAVLLGAGVITLSGLYILWREHVRNSPRPVVPRRILR